MNRREFNIAAIALLAGMKGSKLNADSPNPKQKKWWDVNLPTLGGKQFWADQLFFHEWRIQKNITTGHCRLLDKKNWRHASGTYKECKETLNAIRKKQNLLPMKGKCVIVMHGLMRTRSAMNNIATMLRTKGKYNVFNVSYPSTRGKVEDHAKSLANIISGLDGITEINFVCHSLGNLIVRHWLHDANDPITKLCKEKRIGRMVMLGPPNHQPEIANKAAWLDVTKQIGGKALAQLAKEWKTLEPNLATPTFDFGILAGGKNNESGYNPLIPGDDDMVVSVASTKLQGAKDFRLLPVKHTFMMNDKTVHEYTLKFLQKGWFEDAPKRQPIK